MFFHISQHKCCGAIRFEVNCVILFLIYSYLKTKNHRIGEKVCGLDQDGKI